MLIDLTCVLDKLKSICSVRAFYKLIIERPSALSSQHVFFLIVFLHRITFRTNVQSLGVTKVANVAKPWPAKCVGEVFRRHKVDEPSQIRRSTASCRAFFLLQLLL